MKRLLLALALGAFAAPGSAATTGATFDVGIMLSSPGTPPSGGGGTPPSGGGGGTAGSPDFCVSQSLSDATGAVVRVVCKSGQFVSIEANPSGPFLGVHGGAFRYYFANGLPAHLRFLGDSNPWVGPGTVTSIRVKYLEDLDGIVEMQVGF